MRNECIVNKSFKPDNAPTSGIQNTTLYNITQPRGHTLQMCVKSLQRPTMYEATDGAKCRPGTHRT